MKKQPSNQASKQGSNQGSKEGRKEIGWVNRPRSNIGEGIPSGLLYPMALGIQIL